MKSRFIAILGILAAVLLGWELVARRALPGVPPSSAVERNLYRFRGWPEYISGGRASGDTREIVLLANSQAYGGEFAPHKIYAARMEVFLKEDGLWGQRNWEVLNWSTDGMTSIELMLLADHLRTHPPDLVLAVTGYADYAAEHAEKGFLYCRSDVPRLAVRPHVAGRIPASYLRRHAGAEDVLTFLARDRCALLRYREYLWSWMETRFPGIHGMFYAPTVNYIPWAIKAKPITKPLRRSRHAAGDPVVTYQGGSRRMLEEYVEALSKIPARVIVVTQPIHVSEHDSRIHWHEVFDEDLGELTARHGVTLWRLADALPASGFLTSSHLKPENHDRMARLLLDKLSEEYPDAVQ